jgi:hypothetical protein
MKGQDVVVNQGNKWKYRNSLCFFCFFVKRVPGRGPEWREPNKAVLCPLIIIILHSYYYILLLNYKIINHGEPSQSGPETELPSKFNVLHHNCILRSVYASDFAVRFRKGTAFFIIEGATEKVLQCKMPLKSIYFKNSCFNEKNILWILQIGWGNEHLVLL